uniref:Calponin-homology (CH) domain-containing protein n=1 Tax=Panagrolaimus sp. PS1159 TaxID=55785 RepID=A0AC35FN33_9BILA
MEHEVINWIETITRKFAPKENAIGEWLKDGTILCQILDTVYPGSLKAKINTKKSQFSAAENITNFLESAKNVGIDESNLFELSDLLDEKDIGKIIKTLAYLKENVKIIIPIQFI